VRRSVEEESRRRAMMLKREGGSLHLSGQVRVKAEG